MHMTQFTKDFIKSSIIWTILFGIIFTIALDKYAESKAEDMVYSLSMTPLYVCMIVGTVAASIFAIFISWFAIGRVLNGGCLDVPANFGKWLRNYAIILIAFSALMTAWNIFEYKDRIEGLEKAFTLLAVSGRYEGTRMLPQIKDFKDNFMLIELGSFAVVAVSTLISLPILKRRFDSL